MNRRRFFQRTVGAIVTAAMAPWVKGHVEPAIGLFNGKRYLAYPSNVDRLHVWDTFHGARIIFDRDCPDNRIYFMSADGLYLITQKGVEPLF